MTGRGGSETRSLLAFGALAAPGGGDDYADGDSYCDADGDVSDSRAYACASSNSEGDAQADVPVCAHAVLSPQRGGKG